MTARQDLPENRLAQGLWLGLAAVLVAFHIGLIFSGLVPNLVSRPLHMALILPWVFLYGATGRRLGTGAALCAVGVAGSVWIAWNADSLSDQYGFLESRFQVWLAFALLGVVIEAARRAIGWPLPMVALAALLYAFFGQHIPGEFGHSGTPLRSFLGTMVVAEGGIWGSLTAVSVGVVSIFVIFGAVLNAGEAGQGFMNVAAAAAGRLKGGAAKVSVLSSALFGSISGSASANVASTGAITLPAMAKLGYPRRLAAGVEAVASSGGQIMPPLMGAGAFVMVELTGTPYTQIIAAAFLPAILYFWAVWVGINAYATRFDLRGIDAADRPVPRDVMVTALFFLIPFAVLLLGMFVLGYTPQYAACLAIIAGAVLLLTGADLRLDARRTGTRVVEALLTASKQVAMIASIILCASIIIGVLGVTGLGVKITSVILEGSGGLLWASLLLTALACLVLGMEVPTTAAYVICVSVAGPALIELGLEPLQAHLFVFWFALLSTITPPVCGAVFIAAGMIGENWLRVAVTAMALGVGLYLIPLGMIAQPAIIGLAQAPGAALMAFGLIGAGLAAISFALIARAPVLLRALFAGLGVLLIFGPAVL
ncbi:TRAP transporter fused permease subunit [Lutimaribacter sp. EGI FJ00015]|uniref:TRAP transporter fused permease subunit n=1 Tax=Lutimaribacter degradans TaxID=2945989 RepID=A0ACC5ZY37_9RHOB|nr:TRAP transporter fused permease subunit [Lutimaribacter sp. EGI FJ00013]MCM2563257.1 TRAP transporter fused permease subunit [Lutimaribacter sp. EGI FJ00013]MCO0614420.1 TRAP transporter fused permease subunit [Lutimaribacter sp. EGI FJ00015]MCO0635979.1 TRAP transporter fused permease subunit [Lutimaribacter sp. EGI FJ00014]